MTSNQIAYYKARSEAKHNKLMRRENKRHNLASESVQATQATASMIGAQASAQQAQTRQKEYELEWEKEYGWHYGTPRDQMMLQDNYVVVDMNGKSHGIATPTHMGALEDAGYNNLALMPYDVSPITYWQKTQQTVQNARNVEKTEAETAQQQAKYWETLFGATGRAAKTAEIAIGTLRSGYRLFSELASED